MRKVIEYQLKIGQDDIGSIPIDLRCLHEIPQLLLGLQFIYPNRKVRHEAFRLLKRITPKQVAADKGRSGMDLWKILVLDTLRLNCNWDYDKLHNIAKDHKTVRELLGHDIFEFDQGYGLLILKDNISLLTPKQLGEILDQVVLPKKGKLSKTDKQIEYADRNYDSPEARYFSSKCIKQCP